MFRSRICLFALASAGLFQSQIAMAQDCVTEQEVSSLFVYAAPSLIDAVRSGCGGQLRPDGFFATDGDAVKARYALLQDETWPQAKRAMLLFANRKDKTKEGSDVDPSTVALLNGLPDNAVRPLVDAIIVKKVAEEVKPGNCRKIERVIAAIAPIEPKMAGVLIGTLFGLVPVNDPEICPIAD